MTTTTQPLTSWLLDQIAADEAVARAAFEGDGRWETYTLPDVGPSRWTMTGVGLPDDDMGHRTETMFTVDAAHIARHDPARVLAQCEAHRRIVELHEPFIGSAQGTPPATYITPDACGVYPCPTLRILATIYADRDGYQETWRP